MNHYYIPLFQSWKLLDMYFWQGITARPNTNPCGALSYEVVRTGNWADDNADYTYWSYSKYVRFDTSKEKPVNNGANTIVYDYKAKDSATSKVLG